METFLVSDFTPNFKVSDESTSSSGFYICVTYYSAK